jgi:hypothetical protein
MVPERQRVAWPEKEERKGMRRRWVEESDPKGIRPSPVVASHPRGGGTCNTLEAEDADEKSSRGGKSFSFTIAHD